MKIGQRHGKRTLIQHLDFILPVDQANSTIRDGAVVVEGDRLAAVGPTDRVVEEFPPEACQVVIDGRRMGATPGFIDSHVHLHGTVTRGRIVDSIDTRSRIVHWMMPFYGAMTAEDERVSVQVGLLELLRCGTTCFLDMGTMHDTGIVAEAAAQIGNRGIVSHHAADTVPEPLPAPWSQDVIDRHFPWADTKTAVAALRDDVVRWNGYADGLIRCWPNLQGKEACSLELHLGAKDVADEFGVGTSFHICSDLKESQTSLRRYGRTPVARLADHGGLGSNSLLAHAVSLTEAEVELCAELGAKVAFCPGTAFNLAKGATRIGKYPELMAAGVTVGVGTDGASASGSLDVHRMSYLVAGMFKDARMDPTLVGAEEALRMITIDGARALLWDDQIGSLEPGKKADLLLFDLRHPEWQPYGDPTQTLIWGATSASLAETWVNGEPLYRQGDFLTFSGVEDLYAEARERSEAIVRRAGLEETPHRGSGSYRVSG